MSSMRFEVPDPVKALEQLLDILIFLKYYAETGDKDRLSYWEQKRDNWIKKYNVKNGTDQYKK